MQAARPRRRPPPACSTATRPSAPSCSTTRSRSESRAWRGSNIAGREPGSPRRPPRLRVRSTEGAVTTDIVVPVLGESVTEATIAKWLKRAGDAVATDEPVVELETEKATVELGAPSAGVLAEILVAEGED